MDNLPGAFGWLEFAASTAELGVQWLAQSTFVIAAGMAAAAALRSRSPVLQSAVYRTTMVAVLACPLAAYLLSAAGVTFITLKLPSLREVTFQSVLVPAPPAAAAAANVDPPAPAAEPLVAQSSAAPPAEFSATDQRIETNPNQAGGAPGGAVPAGLAAQGEPAPPAIVASPPPSEPPAPAEFVLELRQVTSTRWLVASTVILLLVAWLLGSLVMLARLAAQHVQLAQVRRGAVDAGQDARRLCVEAARHLHVSPPPVLRTPFMSSPCLAGLLRPVVLLPDELPEFPLSAVLVHELAHLRRRDNVWGLVRHVMVALLYVQPLVWRLARRTEAAAEAVCDDYVVHFGGDREAYATTLVSLAERNLLPTSSAVVPLVTFRSLLGQRVTRILDQSRRLTVRLGMAALSLVVAGGFSAALLAGLMGPERTQTSSAANRADDPTGEEPAAKESKETTAANAGDEKPQHISGSVTGPDGKPAAGADVVLIARRRTGFIGGRLDQSNEVEILGQARCDASGGFEFAPKDLSASAFLFVQVLARAKDCGLAWRDVDPDQDQSQMAIALSPATQATGRLVDSEGRPAANVHVKVSQIGKSMPSEGRFAGVDSLSAKLPAEVWPDDVVSDAQGRYVVAGVATETDLYLSARDEPYAPHTWLWDDAKGSEQVQVLSPAQVITGTVVAADTGKPLPFARLTAYQGWDPNRGGMAGVAGQADEQGRFRLNPYAANSYVVTAFAPDGAPYPARKIEFEWPAAAREHELRLELKRGALLTGLLVESGAGPPVAGASIRYEPRRNNKFDTDDLVTGWQAGTITDSLGGYAMAVPPGPGHVIVLAPGGRYAVKTTTSGELRNGFPGERRMYVHAYEKFDLAPEAREHVLSLEVTRGATIVAEVVGPDGRAPERLLAAYPGMSAPYGEDFGDQPREVLGGRLNMHCIPPEGELTVNLLDPVQKAGKIVKLSGKDAGKPLRIELEKCGSAVVRLVDTEDKPVPGAKLPLHIVFTAGASINESSSVKVGADETFAANFDRMNHWEASAADGEGLVRYEALIPEAEYQFFGGDEDGSARLERSFRVQPGEVRRLDDYLIRDPDAVLQAAEEMRRAKPKENETKPQAGKEVDEDVLTVRGTVVDPASKPVAGATVWAAPAFFRDAARAPLGSTTSDVSGRFELSFNKSFASGDVADGWRHARVAAMADGFGPGWIECGQLKDDSRPTLRLVPDEPIEGRLVNLEGQPVAGAKVHVIAITRAENEDLTPWLDVLRKGDTYINSLRLSATMHELATSAGQFRPAAETDASGAFRLTGVGRQRRASLRISGAGMVVTDVSLVTAPIEPLKARFGNPEPYFDRDITIYGSKFQVAAEPSQPIVGKVVDVESKAPLSGVRVIAKKFAGKRMSEFGIEPVVSNERGEFRLDGMPRGEGNIVLVSPVAGQPYFSQEVSVPVGSGLEATQLDVALHRGRLIQGRVTNKATGKPVDATVKYFPWPDNPHLASTEFKRPIWMPTDPRTDSDGRFELVGLPGQGLIMVECRAEPFPSGQGLKSLGTVNGRAFRNITHGHVPTKSYPTAVHKLDMAESSRETSAEIMLDPGATVDLQVVDSAGKPVDGLNINGLWPLVAGHRGEKVASNVQVRGLAADEKRTVFIHQPERNLGRAIEVDARSGGSGPMRVVLEPCGTVTARLLDKDGEPVQKAYVSIGISLPDSWGMELESNYTDTDGRLTSNTVLPGRKFDISINSEKTKWQSVAKDLAVAPGETVDLGEFDVTAEKRPEPKRTPAKPVAQDVNAQPAEESALVIRGTLLDPDGKPLAGGEVKLIRSSRAAWAKGFPLPTAKSDATGRFAFELPKSLYDGIGTIHPWPFYWIVASAERFAPSYAYYEADRKGTEPTIRLVANSPIEGRLIDLEGRPAAGVKVRVTSIWTNEKSDPTKWLEAIRSGTPHVAVPYEHTLHTHLSDDVDQPGNKTTTDADGKFRITAVGRGRLATLRLTGGGIVGTDVRVINWPIEPMPINVAETGSIDETYYGEKFQLAVEPSQPIEGVVRDADSNEPLAGVRVFNLRMAGARSRYDNQLAEAGSDAQGHYRLEGMPKGEGNEVFAMPADDQPYFMREFQVPTAPEFSPVKLDLPLHRGVLIRGTLRDKVTGAPVKGTVIYLPWPDNPARGDLPEFNSGRLMGRDRRYGTDDDGRFTLVGLPGRGLVSVTRVENQPYPSGQGFRLLEIADLEANRTKFWEISQLYVPDERHTVAVKDVRIPEEQAEFATAIELEPGGRLSLLAVDEQGAPVSGITLGGIWPINHVELNSGPEFQAVGLKAGEKRWVIACHVERNLGGVAAISLDDAAQAPVPIVLRPNATIKGRLVDADGKPIHGMQVRFRIATANDRGGAPGPVRSDKDGRFISNSIFPGAEYDLGVETDRGSRTIAEKLAVVPSASIDIGEINVASKQRAMPNRAAADPPDRFDFAGKVVDTDGKPVAGAKIHVIYYTPSPIETRPRTESKADGSFAFAMTKTDFDTGESNAPWEAAQIVVTSEGYGAAWMHAAGCEKTGAIVKALRAKPNSQLAAEMPSTVRLVRDDAPIVGRILNLEGQPIAGAKVHVLSVLTTHGDSLDAWLNAVERDGADYYQAQKHLHGHQGLHVQRQIMQMFPARTSDAAGRFRIEGIGRERIVHLQIEPPGCETRQVYARTRPGPLLRVPERAGRPDDGEYVYYGATFDHVAAPSQPVVGVVRDADSGKPLADVKIQAYQLAGENVSGWSNGYIHTTTDAEGRYTLAGLPLGKNELIAVGPKDEPYLVTVRSFETTPRDDTTVLDIQLKRGLWVRGRVTDGETGEPLRGRIEFFAVNSNPHLKDAPGLLRGQLPDIHADADGRYRIAGLPGPGLVTVMANNHHEYPRGAGQEEINEKYVQQKSADSRMFRTTPYYLIGVNCHMVREVNPGDGEESAECDFALQAHRGANIHGTLVDAQDKPVEGAVVCGATAALYWQPVDKDAFVVRHLKPGESRRVLFYREEQNLGGSALVEAGRTEPLVVTLVPCGTISGRLLDVDGSPADNFVLRATWPPGADQQQYGLLSHSSSPRTDSDGRFSIGGLISGLKYAFAGSRFDDDRGMAIDEVQVSPGETKSLGDVKLHPAPE